MTDIEHELVGELVRLRHGWGLAATRLRTRMGSRLLDLCEITASDTDREIRRKTSATLKRLAADFSSEDQLAIEFALGEATGVQHRLLSSRVTRLAKQLHCADRTARRHMDHAFELLAGEAAAVRARETNDADNDPEKGFYVRQVDALVRLDLPHYELVEKRTIIATRPDLARIGVRVSVPRGLPSATGAPEIDAEVQHGALLEAIEPQGEGHSLLMLSLPRPLERDHEHTYSMRYRLPSGYPTRHHYALVPLVRCESLRVRARFDVTRPPAAVWRLDRVAPRALDLRTPGPPLHVDGVGEVAIEFAGMERGFGYGLAWTTFDELPG